MNLRVAIAKIANHLRTLPIAVLTRLAGDIDVEWFVNGAQMASERDSRTFFCGLAQANGMCAVSRDKLAVAKISVENMSIYA